MKSSGPLLGRLPLKYSCMDVNGDWKQQPPKRYERGLDKQSRQETRFTLYSRANSKYQPPGGLIFGGAILGGLYMRGLFSEFYDIIHNVFFLVAVRKCLKTF